MRSTLLILALLFCLQSLSACATLPNAESFMEEAPVSGAPQEIVGVKGQLPARKTAAIIKRLEHQAEPTNILQRHQAVMESLSGEPLIAGNKVTLIKDDKAIDVIANAIENAK